jgi:hypothetical protein
MLAISQHLRDVTHLIYSVSDRRISMNACPNLDPTRDINPHDARIDLKPGPGEDDHCGEISRPVAALLVEILQSATNRSFTVTSDDGDTIVWERDDHAQHCRERHDEVAP